MPEQFVSEPIVPVAGTMDTVRMARGEPGFPGRFVWRDTEYGLAEIVETWKETGSCTSGGNEKYVRKHWFKITTTTGDLMTIYFERQPASRHQRRKRWWLFTVSPAETD